jgi:hypothetical protein
MHMPSAVYCVAHGMLVQLDVTVGALTVWPLCTCAVHTRAPSLTYLYMCYEFLGSREEKMYFADMCHVNIYI